jgi:CubicO group peptidase (beta-lactamase class C family)
MRRLGSIALALALVAPPAGAQQAATALAPPAASRSLLASTQAVFDRYVAEKKVPGIVGAFGVGDFPTVFVSAGRISGDPNAAAAGPDTLWRVYSMTKPITGMAAMLLVEDGKIALDDPLSKYFPAFKTMRVLTSPDTSLATEPAKREITIRMLLTHTSGLGYNINAKGPILKEYERLGLLPGQFNVQTETAALSRPGSLQAFAAQVAKAPLIYQPGTTWHYSIGLDLLGAVIEKASGMPFDTFVQRRLLDPLKMTSTFWQVPVADVGRLASNYIVVGGVRVPFDPAKTSVYLRKPAFPYGGAGLVSSARDYDRFLHMLQDQGSLDGVTVMKPETVRLAMSNLLPPGITFDGGNASPGVATGFGAGGFVTLADSPAAGKGTYGWDGAANTFAFVDPAKKARGVVMVNYLPYGVYPLRADVLAALRADARRLHGE